MKPKHYLATAGGSFAASFLCGVALLCAAHPAFAQAVGSAVDVRPLLSNVIDFLAVVLTVGAGVVSTFGVKLFASKTRINDAALEKLMAERVNDVLIRAIDYAHTAAAAEVNDPKNTNFVQIQFDNWFVAQAVGYAVRSMPDLMAFFKLTPDRIADMVRARLASYIAAPAPNSGALVPAASALTVQAGQATVPVGGAPAG